MQNTESLANFDLQGFVRMTIKTEIKSLNQILAGIQAC